MAITLAQLLKTEVITGTISRIKTPMSRLQDFFGMGPGGINTDQVSGRDIGWDIFDQTRLLATGRAPATGPARVTRNPVGHVSARCYRSYESIVINEEEIFRGRPLGQQYGEIDQRGQNYIARQESYLAQKFKNMREFMVSRMLRGGFDITQDGDDYIPVELAAGMFSVDFQVPAGNKSQLNMTGGGDIIGTSWANAAAPIISDLMQINAAFEELHGRPLAHVWMNSNTFQNVLANTQVINTGGTANTFFQEMRWSPAKSAEQIADTGIEVTLRGFPLVKFHVYDGGLTVNGVYSKFFPDNYASFLPEPAADWVAMKEGSELIREKPNTESVEAFGLKAWALMVDDPPGFDLRVVDNCIPALFVPKAVTYAAVVF